MMGNAFATCFRLMLAASPFALAACAPAPLYISPSPHKGAVTSGEIPRDARGEPVWGAIRPAPADSSPAHAAPLARQEGDTRAPPHAARDMTGKLPGSTQVETALGKR